jgi:hypothetical protein
MWFGLTLSLGLVVAAAASGGADPRDAASAVSSVGSVRLVSAPRIVGCQRAADFMRYAIPCPGILPESFTFVWTNGRAIGPQGECRVTTNRGRLGDWYVLGARFPLGGSRFGHLVIAAAPRFMTASTFVRKLVHGGRGVSASIERVTVGGVPGARVDLPAQTARHYLGTILGTRRGVWMGRTILIWHRGRETVGVGAFGTSEASELETVIATSLSFPAPTRSQRTT